MRSQVHVVWLDVARASEGKKAESGGDAFKIRPLSHERVVEPAPFSLEKLQAPAGSMSRVRRLNLCLTWCEKLSFA